MSSHSQVVYVSKDQMDRFSPSNVSVEPFVAMERLSSSPEFTSSVESSFQTAVQATGAGAGNPARARESPAVAQESQHGRRGRSELVLNSKKMVRERREGREENSQRAAK